MIEIIVPDYFDDHAWEEVRVKGRCPVIAARYEGRTYRLSLYDPTRLAEDVSDEVEDRGFFLDQNLLVLKELRREELEAALARLARSNRLATLAPEPEAASSPEAATS
jgi:hypothetical protein